MFSLAPKIVGVIPGGFLGTTLVRNMNICLHMGQSVSPPDADSTKSFNPADTGRMLDLLRGLPSGVLAMSQDIQGLVETSNNLGAVRTSPGAVEIACLVRSASSAALRDVVDTLRAVGRLGGADAQEAGGYPGWKPNPDSPVLAATKQTYRRLFGQDPKVTAVHAGLECGLIGERVQGMDMVSFGPDIKGPHAPGERVRVSSVARFWKLLAATLDDIAK